MSIQDPTEIADDGRLGMFGVGARRLASLGYMVGVSRVKFREREIYMGEFVPPVTLESFLGSDELQLVMFRADMAERCEKVNRGLSDFVVGDVTLSGVLGLTHAAGIRGARSWLTVPSDAERFPHTTEAFHRVNGIF